MSFSGGEEPVLTRPRVAASNDAKIAVSLLV
jgi:hypothetical protein